MKNAVPYFNCSLTARAGRARHRLSKSCVPLAAGQTAHRPQERCPARASGRFFRPGCSLMGAVDINQTPVESNVDALAAAPLRELQMNRPDGQDGHTVAETWPVRLWARLVLALLSQAESEHLIYRTNKKENDSPLTALFAIGRGLRFSFFLHFRGCNSHMKRTGYSSHFSWGSSLVFCFLAFFYAHSIAAIDKANYIKL